LLLVFYIDLDSVYGISPVQAGKLFKIQWRLKFNLARYGASLEKMRFNFCILQIALRVLIIFFFRS